MTLMSAGAMPAAQLVAPTIDVAGQFQQGKLDAAQNQSNEQTNQAQMVEMLAHGAAAALPQGPAGPVDEKMWNSFLDSMEQTGMPGDKVAAFRGNPEMARILLQGSTAALKNQYDAASFERSLKLLDAQIAQAASVTAKNNAPPETFTTLSADEVKQLGLPPGSYQRGADNKITQIGGGGVTVNMGPNGVDYGDPGAGYVWQRDKEGKIVTDDRGAPIAIPFQGGKPYNDQKAADEAKKNKTDQKNVTAGVVVQDIDRALTQIKEDPFWTTGIGAQMTGWIGNTPASNVAALMDSVEANAGFDKLQAMRESSPTGGALGSVTERELQLLQSAIGSLKQSQGPEQLQDNLKRVKNIYLDIIHGPGNGPPREKLSFDEGPDKSATEPTATPGAPPTDDVTQMSDEDLMKQLGM